MKDYTERLELCVALSAAVSLIAAWPHILLIRAVSARMQLSAANERLH